MAEEGARGAGELGRRAEQQTGAATDRRRRLQRVEDKGRGGEVLAAGAQHVGRADVARADRAQIPGAGEARQDQTERDRAEQVAEDEGVKIGERQRHARGAGQNHEKRARAYSCATRPATSVILTLPSSRASSKGVLRQCECSVAGSST